MTGLEGWQDGEVEAASPLDPSHPLNRGLRGDWSVMPLSGQRGALRWPDLLRRNPATLTGGPTWQGPQGRIGGHGSVLFNGTSHYALTSSFGFSYARMTFACWCRFTTTGTSLLGSRFTVFDTSNANTSGCPSFELVGGAGFTYSLQAIIPGVFLLSGTILVPAFQWNHLVWVIDDSITTIKGYINGVPADSNNYGAQTFVSTADSKNIGRRSNGSQFLPGSLDGVRLWDRPFVGGQVRALYDSDRARRPGVLRRAVRRASVGVPAGGGGTTASGDGSSSGTATVSGVGSSVALGVCSANGTATVSGSGASLDVGSGSSSGLGTATATGASLAVGVGSSTGTSSPLAAGQSLSLGSASAAGTSTAAAFSGSGAGGVGSGGGSSTVTGVGITASIGAGASNGAATVSATGSAVASGIGSASGSSTVVGLGVTIGLVAGWFLRRYVIWRRG